MRRRPGGGPEGGGEPLTRGGGRSSGGGAWRWAAAGCVILVLGAGQLLGPRQLHWPGAPPRRRHRGGSSGGVAAGRPAVAATPQPPAAGLQPQQPPPQQQDQYRQQQQEGQPPPRAAGGGSPAAGAAAGPPAGWRPVADLAQLRRAGAVGIRASDGRWIARTADTRQRHARFAEVVWKPKLQSGKEVFSFASVAGTRLGLNRETKLVAQQRYAGHEERWILKFRSPGYVEIQGVGRDGREKLVAAWPGGAAGGGDLSCNATKASHPITTFAVFTPTNCSTAAECWAPYLAEKQAAAPSGGEAERLGTATPLFGSPKPLNASDARFEQSRTIADRVLQLWRRLAAPLRPLLFAEPFDSESLALARARGVEAVTDFEHWAEFGQPTYRGLFAGAFKHADRAWGGSPEMAVYSNSDILYTRTLGQTLGAALRYARELHPRKPLRLMVVGMRVNVDMPADFSPGAADVEQVMGKLAGGGQRYQTNAEDYFAVSRDLFSWESMPPFIVGGVAFDNWFVARANRAARKGEAVVVVDATDTVLALHQNHGEGRKDSHLHPKSRFNRELAVRHGSWARGRVVDARYASLRMPWGELAVVERRRLLFPLPG
eukprot:TRINITY_DN71366_c0_g1_i1.p1 TRINITY_DN71366_c0_g1~~TRINITY_DN71366_c0_g1_i1.p1  ORF type:complete len:602 (+),score=159.39 TRINITY_DN71366_c0_g1_i1:87-1892(+)